LQGWPEEIYRESHSPELVCSVPETAGQAVDLLLVHGIGAGAWVWEGGALEHFARAGYRTWALSLSGHGLSPSRKDLDSYTLGTYANDVTAVLQQIARPTVLIAHSLGGAVAQKVLSRGNLSAGCVLLCSVPPYGLWRASLEMLMRSPELWLEMSAYSLRGLADTNIDVMRRGLFPSEIQETAFNHLAEQLQDESVNAMSGALGWPPFAPPPLSQRNMLVIGGALDEFVPPTDVVLTALYYGVQAHLIPDGGHMLMCEQAGLDAAQIIIDWLKHTHSSAEHQQYRRPDHHASEGSSNLHNPGGKPPRLRLAKEQSRDRRF
jgi:pimeloyl-ACP methyl ester carboxylesterase